MYDVNDMMIHYVYYILGKSGKNILNISSIKFWKQLH